MKRMLLLRDREQEMSPQELIQLMEGDGDDVHPEFRREVEQRM